MENKSELIDFEDEDRKSQERIKELIKNGITSMSGLDMLEEAVLKQYTAKEREEIEKLIIKIIEEAPAVE